MRKAFHSSETKYGLGFRSFLFSFQGCYVQPAQFWAVPCLPKRHIWKSFASSENTSPHCLWSICVDVFVPGCPQCRAAAVVWQFVCALSSGRGRRARSSCCLRRGAAAGSSAPQQTPCAPERHGKNWSWTPLWEEKGRRGSSRGRRINIDKHSLCIVWEACIHIVYELSNRDTKKINKKINNW